jgi:hypothetical protein
MKNTNKKQTIKTALNNATIKNNIHATAGEFIALYESEIERNEMIIATKSGDISNAYAQIKKCNAIISMLYSVDESLPIEVEGCAGDGKIRDFNLGNVGSVVEGLIKSVFGLPAIKEISDEATDAIIGRNANIEIKASLTRKSLSTPMKSAKMLIGVNSTGISIIPMARIDEVLVEVSAGKGKTKWVYPHAGYYGNPKNFIERYLNNLFGFDEIYED